MRPPWMLDDLGHLPTHWDYIRNLVLTPLETVFNNPHPSILLHITWEVLILLIQETKRDIIFHHAQQQTPIRREELLPQIQAVVWVVNKIIALLEYQGVRQYSDLLSLLLFMLIYKSYGLISSPDIHTLTLFFFLISFTFLCCYWCKNTKKQQTSVSIDFSRKDIGYFVKTFY